MAYSEDGPEHPCSEGHGGDQRDEDEPEPDEEEDLLVEQVYGQYTHGAIPLGVAHRAHLWERRKG